jgi:NAD(P)-dependent dehydrogenase (short-subunit alcohol dehydrogenase family)
MARLGGKVALITGAGGGIGRATALAMAANCAKVVVAEIDAVAGAQNLGRRSPCWRCPLALSTPTDAPRRSVPRADCPPQIARVHGLSLYLAGDHPRGLRCQEHRRCQRLSAPPFNRLPAYDPT